MASRYRGGRARRSADIRTVAEEPPVVHDLNSSTADLYRTVLQDSIDLKVSVTRRLSNLNFLARLAKTRDGDAVDEHHLPTILRFAGFLLCDQCKEIRAATFRVIRVSIHTREDCLQLEKAHIDFYIARVLDLALDNEVERMQVILLIRRILLLGSPLSPPIIHALSAIASDGENERERLSKVCLELLCESLVLFPSHLSVIPILRVLLDFLLTCNSPPLSTAVVAAVMHFAAQANNQLPADLCDITQILHPVTNFEGTSDAAAGRQKELTLVDKTVMIGAAKCAIISALRTFEGIHLLSVAFDGVRSLVNVLHFNNHITQEAVLDIISELLYLSGEVEPGRLICDSWALQENFVADEARAVLPHIGGTRFNLSANYLSLLLFVLFQNGLLDALVHMVTSEGPFSQRAFKILGSYLSLANVLLPAEFTTQLSSLPTLVSLASCSSVKQAGKDAITGLLLANSDPARRHFPHSTVEGPMSLFLQHILDMSQPVRSPPSDGVLLPDIHLPLLREVLSVMTNNESVTWNWPTICTLLKAKSIHASDPAGFRILHRLLVFFKTSNKLYSFVQRKHEMARTYGACALCFVDVCLRESPELLEEFLTDFERCLRKAVSDEVQSEVILSPLTLSASCCADYFVLVGRVSSQEGGEMMLEKTGLVALYNELVKRDDVHESYIKLIVSTLDYGRADNLAMRALLRQVANSHSPALRCYVAMHLRTLLRAGMGGFSQWGMDLLLHLWQDSNMVVARTAAEVLDEACDLKKNLDVVISKRPASVDTLPLGGFLTARVLGSYSGFQLWQETAKSQLDKWRTSLNAAYVHFVERMLSSKLLTQDPSDGTSYRSYAFGSEKMMAELFLPEHLYGQLVQHPDGCDMVREEMAWLSQHIQSASTLPAEQIKIALWAVGHIGRTTDGMALLNEFEVLDHVVTMVADHDNLSVRGTAFFVLGLWSVTERGADLLKSRDWLAVRHNRHEMWPLVDQRVSFTWTDTTTETPQNGETSPSIKPANVERHKQIPARLLSYVSDPDLLPEHGPGSPRLTIDPPTSAKQSFSPPTFYTATASTSDDLHKNSGESGFESSDGLAREGRSESAKTNTSDLSLSPPAMDKKRPRPTWKRTISTTPPDGQEREKKNGVVSAIKRSQSTFHRSMEDGLRSDKTGKASGMRRSESRPSFREMAREGFKSAGTILDKMRKKSSNANSPYLLATLDVTSVNQLSSSTEVSSFTNTPSAKEERFMGICLPLKRSIWQKPRSTSLMSAATPMTEECLHGSSERSNIVSQPGEYPSGLDIHTVDKCLACCIAGCDLSTVTSLDAPIVNKRKEVLKFVNTLATPLGHKAAEQGMLQLKNLLPDSYMDVCLYSEVCHLLASYQYKLSIRRLIQELFVDVPVQKCLEKYYALHVVSSVPTEATEEKTVSDFQGEQIPITATAQA